MAANPDTTAAGATHPGDSDRRATGGSRDAVTAGVATARLVQRREGDADPSTDAVVARDPVNRVGETPDALYRTEIALLRARIEELEATVTKRERDLQHVVDRYERLLAERSADRSDASTHETATGAAGDARDDAGGRQGDDSGDGRARNTGLFARLRRIL